VLYFDGRLVYCDCTKVKNDIAALMKGNSFSKFGNTIVVGLNPLESVLRIRKLPVVTLFET